MATKIVTKNSSTASAVPTASDLVQGELAVNVADKRLFTEDNGGAIVELGTNPSTIDINAGSIDGTAIGASSASTGAFTTLTATGIDVTGTVTASAATPSFILSETDRTDENTQLLNASGDFRIRTRSDDGGTNTDRFRIDHATGDISFYEDTGTTAKLFWDASAERLGIGTTSPSTKLQVTGNSSSRNTIVSNATLDGGTTVANPYEGFGFGINFIGRDYGNAVRNYASINTFMQSKSSSSGGGDAGFKTGLSFYTNGGGASGTNPEERMRIDSSGNLLVGTTVANPAGANSVGVGISSGSYGGFIGVTRDGNTPVEINRKTSDGNLITFRKDGSSVGSIGTVLRRQRIRGKSKLTRINDLQTSLRLYCNVTTQ